MRMYLCAYLARERAFYIHISSKTGETPLHKALPNGDDAMVSLLLARGASADRQSKTYEQSGAVSV